MTILLGLVLLITAVVVAVVGTLTQAGGSHLFLFGVEVGVVGMVGLGLVRGDVDRRVTSRRLRLVRDRSLRERGEEMRDRDRLVQDCPNSAPTTPALRAGAETHGR
jgi:hypothetical protein